MELPDLDYLRNEMRAMCWDAWVNCGTDPVRAAGERDRSIEAAAKRYEESDKLFELVTQNRTLKNRRSFVVSTPRPYYSQVERFFEKSKMMVDDVWFYDQFGNSIDDSVIGWQGATLDESDASKKKHDWLTFKEWKRTDNSTFLFRYDVDLLYRYFDVHPPHSEQLRLLDANLVKDYRLPALSYSINAKGPYAILDNETGTVSFENLESGNFTFSLDRRDGKSYVHMNGEPLDYVYKGSSVLHHSDDTKSTTPKVLAPIRNRPWFNRTNNVLHKLLSNGK